MEQVIKSLEQQLELAKQKQDYENAEKQAQEVVNTCSELSSFLVSLLPDHLAKDWKQELASMQQSKEASGQTPAYCDFCGKQPKGKQVYCPFGCEVKFCDMHCLRKGRKKHEAVCFMQRKRKILKTIRQSGTDW